MSVPNRIALAVIALSGSIACRADRVDGSGGDAPPPGNVTSSLVVDANRDGQLDVSGTSDDEGKAAFTATRGAVFLANIDDDNKDDTVDADSDEIDGDSDTADLSQIAVRPWSDASADSSATLSVDSKAANKVRLFRVNGDAAQAASYAFIGTSATLSTDDLKSGALFAIEAIDVVTNRNTWDGTAKVTLEVKDKSGKVLVTDTAQLRVAPVIFQYNTAPTQQVFWTNLNGENLAMVSRVREAAGTGILARALNPPWSQEEGVDQWTQDFFDIGYMSKPGPNGEVVGMKVAIRSAQLDRTAGGIVWSRFLGPDFGGIEIADSRGSPSGESYSMNSFGNWDVIPPYTKGNESFPLGRNIWGSADTADFQPDPVFARFVEAQAIQPGIQVDTSWLVVGHVDEYFSWVTTNTPRGWGMLVGSAKRAKEMLQDLKTRGYGTTKLFVGKEVWDYDANPDWPPSVSAERTINQILADADKLAVSQASQIEIDEAVAKVKNEVGLADDEFTEMPFLFEEIFGAAIAYQPGTVNLLHMDGKVVVPKPFGPSIDGKDPFEEDLNQRLGALGLTVIFADNWDVYHANMGEVHCGTNVSRNMNLKWWESGR